MPSVSDRQARFMAAAAHDPAFASKANISQSVAREFNDADRHAKPHRRVSRKLTPKELSRALAGND